MVLAHMVTTFNDLSLLPHIDRLGCKCQRRMLGSILGAPTNSHMGKKHKKRIGEELRARLMEIHGVQ